MTGNDRKDNTEAAQPGVNHDTFLGTQYAQIVSVTVTDLDITFEFVFVNPSTKKGIVVSRVTMAKPGGGALANLILEAIKQHAINKQEKDKK